MVDKKNSKAKNNKSNHKVVRSEEEVNLLTPVIAYQPSKAKRTVTKKGRQNSKIKNKSQPKVLSVTSIPKIKKPNFFYQRLAFIIIVLIFINFLFHLISVSPNPKIVMLSVNANQSYYKNKNLYGQLVANQLKYNFWDGNKFTINTQTISHKILTKFPELTKVHVVVPLFSSQPIVYIQPNQAAIILDATNGSYIIDTAGYSLMPTQKASNLAQLNLPVVIDQHGNPVVPGKQVLTTTEVSFIQTVQLELAAGHYPVYEFSMPSMSNQLNATFIKQPYYVKFNLQSGDARQQSGTFLAVIHYLTAHNITPSQYIDVRINGRAYYK